MSSSASYWVATIGLRRHPLNGLLISRRRDLEERRFKERFGRDQQIFVRSRP